jgi:hypothetical protein
VLFFFDFFSFFSDFSDFFLSDDMVSLVGSATGVVVGAFFSGGALGLSGGCSDDFLTGTADADALRVLAAPDFFSSTPLLVAGVLTDDLRLEGAAAEGAAPVLDPSCTIAVMGAGGT